MSAFSIRCGKLCRGAAASALVLTAVSGGRLRAQPVPASGAAEEIVVTAQKRQQSVQKVPISITVLSEKQLQRLDVQSLADVARQTPSLIAVSAGPGENELIIRGISSVAGTTSTVGYYLDDTPIQPSSNASLLSQRGAVDPALFDLARVEVLRGPQGTLYGSSSMGGTVRYVTNQPDTRDFHSTISLEGSGTQGGGPNGTGSVMLNLPLVTDKLALRVTATELYTGGYIDRERIDPANYLLAAPGSAVDKNINTNSTQTVRMQLRIQPDASLSITPSIFYQYEHLGAPFQVDVGPGSLHDLLQTRDVSEAMDQRSAIYNLSVHKTFDLFSLVSSTSYFDRSVKLHEDSSKVLAYYFSPPQTYVYPSYMTGTYQNKEFTQELRAVSSFEGPFQIIAGGYFHHSFAPLASVIPDPVGYDAAFGSPFGGEEFYAGTRKATLTEKAFFSEATLKLPFGVTALAGFRWFDVSQKFFQTGNGIFNGGYSAVSSGSSESGVNPKFGLQWQVTPDAMVYATAARGYRPGGPNNPAPAAVCGGDLGPLGLSASQLDKYNSDHIWSYEAGAKTAMLNHAVTVNGDLFYIDWSQIQQQIVLGCGFNITANYGAAISKGGEIEATVYPIPDLRLTGGAAYTHATLSNTVPGTGANAGDPLQDVPRWNASGSAEYTKRIDDTYSAFALLNATYIGNSLALYDRTSPFYEKKGFTVVNLRLGLDRGAAWEAAVFVNNLLNKIGETDLPSAISADLPTTRRYAVNQPRTVGVSLTYRY
jgi:outer membrane receptor protein involved in Fe transport